MKNLGFHLTVNSRVIAAVSSDSVATLTLSIVAMQSESSYWLQMSGIKKSIGGDLPITFVQASAADGDVVEIILTADEDSIPESMKRLNENNVPSKSNPVNDPCLQISIDDEERICARHDGYETLQLLATWYSQRPTWQLEVASLTAAEDGQTTGHLWMQREVGAKVLVTAIIGQPR